MQSSADISIFTKEYFERKLHYYYYFFDNEPIKNGLSFNHRSISKRKKLFLTFTRNQIGNTFFGMETETIA